MAVKLAVVGLSCGLVIREASSVIDPCRPPGRARRDHRKKKKYCHVVNVPSYTVSVVFSTTIYFLRKTTIFAVFFLRYLPSFGVCADCI